MGGSKTYPYGSTATVRGHVLAALGVLKVASADQVRRLMCPGHKDNKAIRNACLDLARHGLTVSEGSARDGNKLWGLTPLGLDAAAEVLGRPLGEMGGTARGAGRSGAPHAMAVNETIIAFTQSLPQPTRPLRRPPTSAPPTPAPAPGPAGIGSVASWATEVSHNLPSTGRNRASVRADAVLQAPEAGLPVLLMEVDNCTEADELLAGKFDRYRRFFRLKAKDHQGLDLPMWRTLYPATGREGHPPIAVVFNPGIRLGERALKNRMNNVMHLAREIWSGSYQRMGALQQDDEDGYYDYTDAIPVLFTTLDRLQKQGPLAEIWWRCGHGQWEDLSTALANPNDIDAWHQRDEERQRRREQQREAQRQQATRETTAWGQTPAPDGRQQLREHLEAQHSPNGPATAPASCERCGLARGGQPGVSYDDAPPEDGRHCPDCRTDLAHQPSGLLKALLGRRS
ncbi:replication-relaxation family protein [Streptomyces sp. NBC_01231]|nr:replication-relaxation family protein [Streptomyces sp. NBC_01231]